MPRRHDGVSLFSRGRGPAWRPGELPRRVAGRRSLLHRLGRPGRLRPLTQDASRRPLGWISSPRGVFLLRRSAQALRLYAPIGRPRPFGRHREPAYLTAMPAACPSRMVRVSTFGLKASNRRRRRAAASSTRLHDRTPRPGGWTHLTARGGGNT